MVAVKCNIRFKTQKIIQIIIMKKILNKSWFKAALGCLVFAIGAGTGYSQAPIIYTFNSSADIANWSNAGQSATVTPSFVAGDAPSYQTLSTGSLGFTGTFGPGGTSAFGGLALSTGDLNLSAYTDLQFDVKVAGGLDQYGQIQSFQPNLQGNPGVYTTSSLQPEFTATEDVWTHYDIPLSDFSGNLSDIYKVNFYVYDGDYTSATTMMLEFDNIEFSAAAVPEPAPLTLFGFGAVALGLATCYRRKLVS